MNKLKVYFFVCFIPASLFGSLSTQASGHGAPAVRRTDPHQQLAQIAHAQEVVGPAAPTWDSLYDTLQSWLRWPDSVIRTVFQYYFGRAEFGPLQLASLYRELSLDGAHGHSFIEILARDRDEELLSHPPTFARLRDMGMLEHSHIHVPARGASSILIIGRETMVPARLAHPLLTHHPEVDRLFLRFAHAFIFLNQRYLAFTEHAQVHARNNHHGALVRFVDSQRLPDQPSASAALEIVRIYGRFMERPNRILLEHESRYFPSLMSAYLLFEMMSCSYHGSLLPNDRLRHLPRALQDEYLSVTLGLQQLLLQLYPYARQVREAVGLTLPLPQFSFPLPASHRMDLRNRDEVARLLGSPTVTIEGIQAENVRRQTAAHLAAIRRNEALYPTPEAFVRLAALRDFLAIHIDGTPVNEDVEAALLSELNQLRQFVNQNAAALDTEARRRILEQVKIVAEKIRFHISFLVAQEARRLQVELGMR